MEKWVVTSGFENGNQMRNDTADYSTCARHFVFLPKVQETGHKNHRNKQRKSPILCDFSPIFLLSVTNCVLLSIDIQYFKIHWWQWQMFLNFYFLIIKIFVTYRSISLYEQDSWALWFQVSHSFQKFCTSSLHRIRGQFLILVCLVNIKYSRKGSNSSREQVGSPV